MLLYSAFWSSRNGQEVSKRGARGYGDAMAGCSCSVRLCRGRVCPPLESHCLLREGLQAQDDDGYDGAQGCKGPGRDLLVGRAVRDERSEDQVSEGSALRAVSLIPVLL